MMGTPGGGNPFDVLGPIVNIGAGLQQMQMSPQLNQSAMPAFTTNVQQQPAKKPDARLFYSMYN